MKQIRRRKSQPSSNPAGATSQGMHHGAPAVGWARPASGRPSVPEPD